MSKKKKLMFVGSSAAGKTTLTQYLNNKELVYKKTQAVEIDGHVIDTPGEYLEHRRFRTALLITSADADIVVFVQDATSQQFRFSPGHASMFPVPVVGIVTKTDAAEPEQIQNACLHLKDAGADPVFCVSAYSGENMEDFLCWLTNVG